MKPIIYQLFVRHFGNLNTTRRKNGTIQQNGCGKFADITEKALKEIQKMGSTHVWLTGILEHASGTGYPGRPADDPKILKGIAGSPYAVNDYFDISPDLALHPNDRIKELKSLIDRCHEIGLQVIIDFIPNHVSRSYNSDVRPEMTFGKDDKTDQFFDANNHFFYLQDEKHVHLPDGEYPQESPPKVTGNNVTSAYPGKFDWYETVKLNFGFDYTTGDKAFERMDTVPKTWTTMDSILAYWQELGVDGFRCDMAHMVPMEFWIWSVGRARKRFAHTYFMAEAYDGDPMKVTQGNVLDQLLEAGFDAVYDSESYDLVKEIYEEDKWANDLDDLLWDETRLKKMLQYAENHDEVRIGSPKHWGGFGSKVGRAAVGFLFGVGKGACMLYNGQEVGEPAIGEEGYSGDDGRSSIFDYTSLPELQKWVNGHLYDGNQLSEDQQELREWYSHWMNLMHQPAFSNGGVYALNSANQDNENYGRVNGETASGHWLYSFIRCDKDSGQAYLVVINFSPYESLHNVEILLPEDARNWLDGCDYEQLKFDEIKSCEVISYCLKDGGTSDDEKTEKSAENVHLVRVSG